MPKPQRDWERIEADYRAGVLSLREIGRKHETPEGTIRSRAKKEGWAQDLTDRVRDRAREKLSRSSRTANADDDAIVEENSSLVADVVQSHRRDIRQSRDVFGKLLAELNSETDGIDVLSELVEQHIDQNDLDPKAANAIRRAVSLPSRAAVLRDLSQSAQRLIALERQAFSVDDDMSAGGDLASDLERARKRAQRMQMEKED